MTSPPVAYRGLMYDSARWEELEFRPGDIVISTPAKCGTTWMQMICALLVFQSPALPADLALLSPWLDMLTRPIAEVCADLDRQSHRRFIKTHIPLDGLPSDDRVTYVCVGRDPRDVVLSMIAHRSNQNFTAMFDARDAVAGRDGVAPLDRSSGDHLMSPVEQLRAWVDDPTPPSRSPSTLRKTLHHLNTFWLARDRVNVVLLHYADLLADLDGQMRYLSGRLDIPVDEELWPSLVEAATLTSMRENAARLVPNAAAGFFLDTRQFFRRGTAGQWRELLDDDDVRRYNRRVEELAPPDLAAWAHRGWANGCVGSATAGWPHRRQAHRDR